MTMQPTTRSQVCGGVGSRRSHRNLPLASVGHHTKFDSSVSNTSSLYLHAGYTKSLPSPPLAPCPVRWFAVLHRNFLSSSWIAVQNLVALRQTSMSMLRGMRKKWFTGATTSWIEMQSIPDNFPRHRLAYRAKFDNPHGWHVQYSANMSSPICDWSMIFRQNQATTFGGYPVYRQMTQSITHLTRVVTTTCVYCFITLVCPHPEGIKWWCCLTSVCLTCRVIWLVGGVCGRHVLADRARVGRPGSRLPLHASITGLGGGILWRLTTYSLLFRRLGPVHQRYAKEDTIRIAGAGLFFTDQMPFLSSFQQCQSME